MNGNCPLASVPRRDQPERPASQPRKVALLVIGSQTRSLRQEPDLQKWTSSDGED